MTLHLGLMGHDRDFSGPYGPITTCGQNYSSVGLLWAHSFVSSLPVVGQTLGHYMSESPLALAPSTGPFNLSGPQITKMGQNLQWPSVGRNHKDGPFLVKFGAHGPASTIAQCKSTRPTPKIEGRPNHSARCFIQCPKIANSKITEF